MIPKHKDWNEDLLAKREGRKETVQKDCVESSIRKSGEETKQEDATKDQEKTEDEQCPVLA